LIIPKIIVSVPFTGMNYHPRGDFITEFRMDFLKDELIPDYIKKIDSVKGNIITIRDREEGGKYKGSTEDKITWMEKTENSILDIEMKHIDKIPGRLISQGRTILSYHRFNGMLSRKEIGDMVNSSEGSIVKIAMNVKDINFATRIADEFRGNAIFVDISGNVVNRLILSFISGVLYTYYREKTGPGQIDYRTAIKLISSIKSVERNRINYDCGTNIMKLFDHKGGGI